MSKYLLLLTVLTMVTTARCDFSWCFQCYWEEEEIPPPNTTSCVDDDPDKTTTILGNKRQNPVIKPFCKGKHRPEMQSKDGYDALKNACYPQACTTSSGNGKCIRWTVYLKDKLVNTTLFCGLATETGCFIQDMANGYRKEACICKGDWCNTAGLRLEANVVAVFLYGLCVCLIARLLDRQTLG